MFCSISGTTPEDPVISSKTWHLYERSLITKALQVRLDPASPTRRLGNRAPSPARRWEKSAQGFPPRDDLQTDLRSPSAI